MKTHTLVGTALTALLLGGFAAGGITVAADHDVARQATSAASKAAKALSRNDSLRAISFAESAVALAPRDPGYRMLLGQGYLKAGRFVSAGQAFADVLSLSGEGAQVGKAALNLALAQVAQGQWDVARKTLADHADTIPARDRGLALALAGDPGGAVELLTVAARAPDADARTRQNLALSLALAGRWADAKTVIAADVSPDEANRRIMSWIEFARPNKASDQVATLLGVKAVEDQGQPVALALNAPVPVVPADAAPVRTAVAEPTPQPQPEAAVAPVEVVQAAPVAGSPRIVFAARREVAQPLPVAVAAAKPSRMIAAKGAFKTPLAAPAKPRAAGTWFVQLGAFDNAGVARDAWKRATRRLVALSGHAPTGMALKTQGAAFYRLSVGGFARSDAVAMCRAYRTKGGTCFVRAGAGDQIAAWAKPARIQTAARVRSPGIQVASR